MVVNYLAAQRQGTQSALTRSEVSGGVLFQTLIAAIVAIL